MNHSTKRLRQTTIFESFICSKRGKILDLMETNVNEQPELRDVLAAAAEKRLSQGMNKNESEVVVPESSSEESCSTIKTSNSSLENFSLTLSQNSEDLFTEESCNAATTSGNSGNCDDKKATLSSNEISEEELKRLPECCPSLPPLRPGETHTVMFKLPIQNGVCPEPYPHDYRDVWDSDHVKMPCSRESKCPVLQNGEKSIQSRWELIERSLLQDITSSYDLQEAILQYNSQYASRWDFRGLHAFFKNGMKPEEREQFFRCTLPAMVRLTLQLPQICTQPIPLLRQKSNHAITFTQKQIACLLSNAFFCTFPRRNVARKRNEQKLNNEYANYPDINFNRLYSGTASGILPRKAEKLKCLLNYFARVTSKDPTGTVTFRHQNVQNFPKWSSSEKGVQTVVVNSDGVIEVEGFGMLQVDFANKFVGGGVLGGGSVQEEIRFVICPELIVSRLFTEYLGIADALLISDYVITNVAMTYDMPSVVPAKGVEQFNKYSGYADSFVWDGDYQDLTPRDAWGRKCTQIVAMDALRYNKSVDQYRVALMQREVNKAFCGFYEFDTAVEKLPAVATGNWGCGAYRGNPHLKFLIQLMATSEIGREMLYFTFKNPKLKKEIKNMYNLLSSNSVRVGDIWALLCDYSAIILGPQKNPPEFYDFFCNAFSAGIVDDNYQESTSSESQESDENNAGSAEELPDVDSASRNEPG